ncbi:MAG: response regulator [Flavobacterium sp.]
MIHVAIVDDHLLFRKSLILLLSDFEGIQVVYNTDDGNEFLEYAQNYVVDVLLLDLQMPIMSGFEVCKSIKETHPEVRVLIVSQLNSKEVVHQIMECGANGFVSKNASPEQLETALHKVYENDFYFDMELAAVIREAILWDNKNKARRRWMEENPLTPREIEIIQMAAVEKSSREIAETLSISYRTVEKHRKTIMEKTQSKNFIGVVLFAIHYRLIQMPEM